MGAVDPNTTSNVQMIENIFIVCPPVHGVIKPSFYNKKVVSVERLRTNHCQWITQILLQRGKAFIRLSDRDTYR